MLFNAPKGNFIRNAEYMKGKLNKIKIVPKREYGNMVCEKTERNGQNWTIFIL